MKEQLKLPIISSEVEERELLVTQDHSEIAPDEEQGASIVQRVRENDESSEQNRLHQTFRILYCWVREKLSSFLDRVSPRIG